MRALFFVAWAAEIAMAVVSIGLLFLGAITNTGNLAAGGGVLIIPSFIGAILVGMWSDIGGIPERRPRMSRNSRRKLGAERERIVLAAQIARLEREAGL